MNTRIHSRALAALALTIAIALLLAPAIARAHHTGSHAAGEHGDAASTSAANAPSKSTQKAATKAKILAIEKRGETVSAAVRKSTEPRLTGLSRQIDLESESNADALIDRLAGEFGEPAAKLESQRAAARATWGEYVIARTLRSSVGFSITAAQIVALHRDGMSWAMVAHGLGLDVESFVRATETERQVALGESRPDGRVARIVATTGGTTSAQIDD